MKNLTFKNAVLILTFSVGILSSCAEDKKINSLSLDAGIKRINPDNGDAFFADIQPTVAPANELSSLEVPAFSINYKNSDMVQILRCKSDFVLRTTTGQDARELIANKDQTVNQEQLRWAWQEAVGQNNKCKLLGSNTSRTLYQDLAAKSGSFFYVLNPCVSEQLSTTGKEGCSYKISISDPITYTNTLKPKFIEKAQELALSEGILKNSYHKLKVAAQNVRTKTQACENTIAIELAHKSFLNGLKKLLSMAVGATVGFITQGPIGAIKGAEVGITLASKIFIQEPPKKVLEKCPEIQDVMDDAANQTKIAEKYTQYIIDLRTEMNSLEASYGNLDKTIASESSNADNSSDEPASVDDALIPASN